MSRPLNATLEFDDRLQQFGRPWVIPLMNAVLPRLTQDRKDEPIIFI
jgi:hypothetical protein